MNSVETCLEKVSNLLDKMLVALNELKAQSEPCTTASKEPEYRKRIDGGGYCYVDYDNDIMFADDVNKSDNIRYAIGNYFHTEEQDQKLVN